MSKNSILICDDEKGVQESLNLILSDHYKLFFAKNGDETIKTLKNHKDIGLVLLDIKMPLKNGIEVLKDIKLYDKNINVIIITGYQSMETATEAIKNGASNYIVKPFDSKTVLEITKNILS